MLPLTFKEPQLSSLPLFCVGLHPPLPQRHIQGLTLAPVNMTLLENKVLVKLDKLTPGGDSGNPMTDVLIRRGHLHTETHRGGHMMREAETGVTCLQAKKVRRRWRPPEPEREGHKARNRLSRRVFQKEPALPTFRSQASHPQNT